LSRRHSLFSSFAKPSNGLLTVLRDALTSHVHKADTELRRCIILFSGFAQLLYRCGEVIGFIIRAAKLED
jgi:hypothetical protein